MLMRPILNIINTMLKECIRSKIFLGLSLFVVLFLIFSVYISSLSLDTPARFILNAGMAGISIISLAVIILFGLYSIYEEKNRNELHVLLNRIPRSSYLFGKFIGIAIVQAIFAVIVSLGIFILAWYFGNAVCFEIFYAAIFAILEFSLLIGVGILFYCLNTGFTLNSLLVLTIYIVGHSTKEAIISFIGLGKYGNDFHLYIVKTIGIILPDFDFFNFKLELLHHQSIPTEKVLISVGYWFFYLTALLLISTAILRTKDV
ncbi:MAG: hypothetical protein KAJ62_06295 [Desulfobacteraceae bacterium]|nr:hypothetical protein [Desulfobacteraceae bacterium]